MKGLVGGALCWWGAWGPGPLGPLKSGPVADSFSQFFSRRLFKHFKQFKQSR